MDELGHRSAIHLAVKGRRQLWLHSRWKGSLVLLVESLINCLLGLKVLLQLGNFTLHLCQ